MSELRRLIVRHRHVAPMVSALLAGMDAGVRILDAEGEVVLERAGAGAGEARHAVTVDGETLGWVEGGRTARGVAAVLSYAAARERDKRALATEALERYRELSLIYDLAAIIGGHTDLEPIVDTAVAELSRLPGDARGFLLLVGADGALRPPEGVETGDGPVVAGRLGDGIVGTVAASGSAEVVEDVASDPRANDAERRADTVVAAPLLADGRTIGVVGATGTGGAFRAADLKVVTAIAALAGPAIGRALAAGAGTARGANR